MLKVQEKFISQGFRVECFLRFPEACQKKSSYWFGPARVRIIPLYRGNIGVV